MKNRLWLSYAWVDNEADDVDFVAQELRAAGVEVRLDRNHIVAGRRLWPQIEKGIGDTSITDGWAIYITEASLRSEACQEELAYALDRAIRTRGGEFPLIGIFPAPVDHALVPGAISTRRWVSLDQERWTDDVASALRGNTTDKTRDVKKYRAVIHTDDYGADVVELGPRIGRWFPIIVAFPADELAAGKTYCGLGPAGAPPPIYQTTQSECRVRIDGESFVGWKIYDNADPHTSVYIHSSNMPSRIAFGTSEFFEMLHTATISRARSR